MPRIFISYRRTDTRKDAGRLYDRLVQAFGKENIFKDVDNIPPGVDFRGVLTKAVSECEVVLVLIGQTWLIPDTSGNRRIDDSNDFVRFEIETALQRTDSVVIPVLVDNASMPAGHDVPDSIKQLTYRNAVVLRDDPDFTRDVNRLIEYLNGDFKHTPFQSSSSQLKLHPPVTATRPKAKFPFTLIVAVAAMVVLVIIFIIALINNKTPVEGDIQTQTALAMITQLPTDITPTHSATSTESSTLAPSDTYTSIPTLSETDVELTIQGQMQGVLNEQTQTAEALQVTETVNAITNEAVDFINQTATATRWTPIPTIDTAGTAYARLTETQDTANIQQTADAAATQTAVATLWTTTPTSTVTSTSTNTPTSTVDPLSLTSEIFPVFIIPASCQTFSPDGKLLAARYSSVYDLTTGQKGFDITGYGPAFSPDGTLLAVSTDGVYNVATGQKSFDIAGYGEVQFSPDGTLLAAGYDGIYNVATGQKLFEITSVGRFSPDGTLLAVPNDGVYEASTGQKLFEIKVAITHFSPDGKLLAIEGDGVYDLATRQKRFEIPGYGIFSPDGIYLAVNKDGVYEVASSQKLFNITGAHFNGASSISFNVAGTLLAVGGDGVYDVSTAQKLFNISGYNPRFSPEGTLLAVGGDGVYDVSTAQELFNIDGSPEFNSNGTMLSVSFVNACVIYGSEKTKIQDVPPTGIIRTKFRQQSNIRFGPHIDASIVGTTSGSTIYLIFARNDANNWYKIGNEQWISAAVTDVLSMPEDLPVENN